ncbi:AsmA family protein [uncultured Polaribacter sp.]|uniref:AsmA family protein n=1 Tax=uncultured Polaribacter sp. TaxID=174711 RepID=UPI002603391C|nr:AsmA family protein [uncultured Polaribacter sp.]
MNKKKSPLKKILKWLSIIVLVLIIILVSIPYLFKDKIVEMVSKTINNNINATVTFKDTDLSLLKNFPSASLTIKDLSVANKAPFLGDTLLVAKELSLSMKITELFKKADEVLELKSISTKDAQVNIILNKDNIGNYDIAIEQDNTIENQETNSSFSFNINEYEVENMNFMYLDKSSNMKFELKDIQHSGKGNFAKEVLDLDTKTTANISLDLENVNYINNVAITLNALIGLDLKNSKYTFKQNTAYINQLPLEFDGFLQLIKETQVYDISFKTPTSSFKNLLALLPKQYSGNLSSIKTEGNFDLNGVIKGTLSEKTIPAFNISIGSKNAMFKYDDLPKAVQNININTKVINKTGNLKDTYINLNHLTFKIDDDVFAANGNIANITTNPKINIAAKGTINLANIGKVYPAPIEKELAGILNADITTSFDMNAIEKGNYQYIKNAGEISVSDFKYERKDVANPFLIDKTSITFNSNSIKLNEFNAKTGDSDIAINGNLDNFYGFLFKNQELKGNFNLSSNNFKVADFLSKDDVETDSKTENTTLKIPAFLDCKFIANAKNVTYDNLILTNVSGVLIVKDETVNLQNVKSNIFGGNIGFNGNVSTKETTSKFAMNLNLKELKIADSFSTLDMLKSIAPIAETIEGKINSTINISGNLNDDMTPNLNTITGDLFGKLLNPNLNGSNSKVLSLLGDKVSFLDASKLNLDGINAYMSFENGEVTVKPIPLKYNDIAIEIGGKHNFDTTMSYDIVFDVPVKYLGTEVTSILSKLSPKEAAEIKSIPVKTNLSGSFTSPKFTSNMKEATNKLVTDLIEKQKQSLINKGKDKLTDIVTGGKKDSTNVINKIISTDKVKNVLGSLFGKKKKDTVKKN